MINILLNQFVIGIGGNIAMDTIKKLRTTRNAKKVVEKTATKTVEVTIGILKWVFILLIIYISIVTFLGYITTGDQFLTNIATISVGGFWAFLFGYFGWRLGQTIENYFLKLREKGED
jgi:hypothetical protein